MPDGRASRGAKGLGGFGWGFGCLVMAVGLFILVDDSSPEALAGMPAIVAFTAKTVGKLGLCLGLAGIGFGLAGWEAVLRLRRGRAPAPAPEDLPLAEPLEEPGEREAQPVRKLKGRPLAGGLMKGKKVAK